MIFVDSNVFMYTDRKLRPLPVRVQQFFGEALGTACPTHGVTSRR